MKVITVVLSTTLERKVPHVNDLNEEEEMFRFRLMRTIIILFKLLRFPVIFDRSILNLSAVLMQSNYLNILNTTTSSSFYILKAGRM